eukprot:scaffold136121_cov52-Prasinocladus_malaysianus.AAC.1
MHMRQASKGSVRAEMQRSAAQCTVIAVNEIDGILSANKFIADQCCDAVCVRRNQARLDIIRPSD